MNIIMQPLSTLIYRFLQIWLKYYKFRQIYILGGVLESNIFTRDLINNSVNR